MSLWDSKYFINYDNNIKSFVSGVNSPTEQSSFFGSKLIKLPKQIVLDKWDNDTGLKREEERQRGREGSL